MIQNVHKYSSPGSGSVHTFSCYSSLWDAVESGRFPLHFKKEAAFLYCLASEKDKIYFHAMELLLLTLVRNDRTVAGRIFEMPGSSSALRQDERSRLQLIGVS